MLKQYLYKKVPYTKMKLERKCQSVTWGRGSKTLPFLCDILLNGPTACSHTFLETKITFKEI